MSRPDPTSLAARFRAAIQRILQAITHSLPQAGPAAGNTLAALNTRATALGAFVWLHRMADGLARLVDRVHAGALKPAAARTPSQAASRAASDGAAPALPRGFGWLAQVLPEPQPLAAEIAALLADPALQPLLDREPARFGRLLRPLCRALGIAPPPSLAPPSLAPPSLAPPSLAPPPSAKPRAAVPVETRPAAPLRAAPPAPSATPLVGPNPRPLGRRHELALGAFPGAPKFAV